MGVDGHFLVGLIIIGRVVVGVGIVGGAVGGCVGCVEWEGVVFEAPSVEFTCLMIRE